MFKLNILNSVYNVVAITSLAELFFYSIAAKSIFSDPKTNTKLDVITSPIDSESKKLGLNTNNRILLNEAVKNSGNISNEFFSNKTGRKHIVSMTENISTETSASSN